MPDPGDKMPLSITRQIDTLCDRFEQAFQDGPPPAIETYLQQVEPGWQQPLLRELVSIELDFWHAQGAADPGQKVANRHRDLAERIEPIVANWESERRAAVQQTAAVDQPTADGPSQPGLLTPAGSDAADGLRVRCPYCHYRLELRADADLTDIRCPSCEASFQLSGRDEGLGAETPSQIGQFELIDRLGSGSFGVVWKAHDRQLDRLVTVKIPHRTGMVEENEKILREARSAAQLRHPNIISIHEVGRDRERLYIVSDFVDGTPLSTVLEQGRLSQREAVELLVPIVDALAHAHQQGVIHRDIKPSNVILDDAGQPHLTDFGLARRETGESTMTLAGQVLGTPAYISPEQAQGDAHQANAQSDIYSLGVMLFQMITGEMPFRGSSAMLLHQAIHRAAPSPRRFDRAISLDLETITLKCLEKEPALRYGSARALAEDLARFLRSEPIGARPLRIWQRGWRWFLRRRRQAGFRTAIAGLAVVAIVSGGSAWWVRHSRRIASKAAEDLSLAEAEAAEQAAGLAALTQTNQLIAAYAAWEKGWPVQARRLLQLVEPATMRAAERGLEWRLLECLTRPPVPRVLAGHHGAVNELAVFPDRRRVASVGEDGLLKIWDTVTAQCLRTIDFGRALPGIDLAAGGLHSVAISPDGRTVLAGADIVGLCDLQRGGEVRELLRADSNVESLAFSDDGSQIAAGVRYAEIHLVSLEGELLKRVPNFTRMRSLEYLPQQHQWLASHSSAIKSPSPLRCWDASFSEIVRTFEGEQSADLAWAQVGRIAPDGITLAAASGMHSRVIVLEYETGAVVADREISRAGIVDLCFSTDGTRLATAHLDGTVCCLRLHDAAEASVRLMRHSQAFLGHPGAVNCVRFVDAESLATCGEDGLVKVWDPFEVPGRIALPLESTLNNVTRFTPSGEQILHADSFESQLSLIDATTGDLICGRSFPDPVLCLMSSQEQVAVVSRDSFQVQLLNARLQDLITIDVPHEVSGIDFSPDGKTLATIDQDEIICFRAADGQLIARHRLADSGSVVKYSHHGEWLAYGGEGDLLGLWNRAATQRAVELSGTTKVRCLAFSPDDQLLASGHSDGIVRLWQIDEGKLLAELVGHSQDVTQLFFSPDGRSLISTTEGDTSRVWSIPQQVCLGVLSQNIVALSPRGQQMVVRTIDQGYADRRPVYPATFIETLE